MTNVEHIQPDSTLMARLHAACRPQKSSIAMRASESGEYLLTRPEGPLGVSTLGTSLKRKLQNA